MDRKISRCFYFAMLVGVIFLGVAVFGSASENVLINNEKITPFTDGWLCGVNGQPQNKRVTLPAFISAEDGEKVYRVSITNTLPKEYAEGMTICFRSSQELVRVLVNGVLMYEYGYEGENFFGKSPGSPWNFVRLDKNTQGGQIVIELASPYGTKKFRVNEVQYGSKNANVFSILNTHASGLFLSLLIVILGVAQLILHACFGKHIRSMTLLYLGLFSVMAGTWAVAESKMLQFFFADQAPVIFVSYMMLMLLPIPILLFIAKTHELHKPGLLYFFCCVFLMNFAVAIALQVLGVMDFVEYSPIILGLICIAAIGVAGDIVLEMIKYKNRACYVLGIGAVVLGICCFIDVIRFYMGFYDDGAFFVRLGVLFYSVTLSVYIVRNIIGMAKRNIEIELLEHLAYVDMLTNLQNRNTFEQRLGECRNGQRSCACTWIGIFDVNDLKATNDQRGHNEGDQLIIKAAECLKQAFCRGEEIYRIGGDEFAVVAEDVSDEEMGHRLAVFQMQLMKMNQNSEHPLRVACGMASYDSDLDKDIDGLYVRADGKMYENKKKMKKEGFTE